MARAARDECLVDLTEVVGLGCRDGKSRGEEEGSDHGGILTPAVRIGDRASIFVTATDLARFSARSARQPQGDSLSFDTRTMTRA